MASNSQELQAAMRAADEEGIAPIQNLGAMDPAQVPRPADRLYPADFTHSRDAEMEGKMQLKYSLPAAMGQKFLTDGDVDYLYNKGKEQEMYNFDAWYATLFDHSDPAQLQMSRSINPAWFQRRMSAVDKVLDMQRRVAKMNLFGIQDKEDVMMAYAISTGRIDPKVYDHSFISPVDKGDAVRASLYKKGIFAPRTFEDFTAPASQNVSATMPMLYSGVANPNLRLGKSDLTGFVSDKNQMANAPFAYKRPGLTEAASKTLARTTLGGTAEGTAQKWSKYTNGIEDGMDIDFDSNNPFGRKFIPKGASKPTGA